LGTDQTISDEAVRHIAAAMVGARGQPGAGWTVDDFWDAAADTLADVVPHIEAAIREAIAAEIEKMTLGQGLGEFAVENFQIAARVARGGSR
jgi:hypothetical protein